MVKGLDKKVRPGGLEGKGGWPLKAAADWERGAGEGDGALNFPGGRRS
jgi:hypothetical protein